jgi:ferredoxin
MSHTVEVVVPAWADVDGAGETHAVEVAAGESILAAARAAGVWLPADCQQGWCTRCAARLTSGEVDQSAARRYYDADAAADLVLTCTATPETDCRVEGCRYETMLDHRAAHDLPPGNAKR